MGLRPFVLAFAFACGCSNDGGSPSPSSGAPGGGAGGVIQGCHGFPTPCGLLSGPECISQLGCHEDSDCSGVPKSCLLQLSSVACNAIDGCHWDNVDDECDGFADSCLGKFSKPACEGQPGCTWQSACSGVALTCDALPASVCSSQHGCVWAGGGSGGSGGAGGAPAGGSSSGGGGAPSGGGTGGGGATGAGCPGAQNLCGGACVDLASDPLNCGACGTSCNPLDKCVGGQCVCASGLFCDGWCVGANDPKHCGACGNACPLFGSCQSGKCSCPTGTLECAGTCVDLQYDSKNCGACGKACGTGQTCSGAACKCSGSGTYCASTDKCVDTVGDASNCGACGVVCPSDAVCALGKCYCKDSAKTACGTICVNTTTDASHCGSCNYKCPSKYICSGTCQCAAPIVGTPVQLTNGALEETRATAVWDGAHVGLLYSVGYKVGWGDRHLNFALLNADGTRAMPSDLTVTATGMNVSTAPALATNGNGFMAAWVESAPGVEYRLVTLSISAAGVPGTRVVIGPASGSSNPAAAWSSKGADYVVVNGNGKYGELQFRHLGTGGVPYPPVAVSFGGAWLMGLEMAQAPDGSFQIVADDSTLHVVNVDQNGAAVGPVTALGSETHGQFAIVHDGAAFLKTWMQDPYSGTQWNLRASRTSGAGWPLSAGSKLASEFHSSGSHVALNGPSTAALAWTSGGMLRVKRFSLPASPASTPLSLAAAVMVAPSGTVPLEERIALSSTGSHSLLALWPAKGNALDLWAAPLDLQSCP
ncbi:MAG: hypothetical protein IT377_12760 [Polyangiaceae bacterium]|nr:hypothetical protein [Polyangiaceae bacterium]